MKLEDALCWEPASNGRRLTKVATEIYERSRKFLDSVLKPIPLENHEDPRGKPF
jgi:hypothetical protein